MGLHLLVFFRSRTVAPPTSNIYYVSKEGGASDSNAGTQASPWLTVNKVKQVLNKGDTVLFRAGDTWPETIRDIPFGTVSNPIKIGSYGTANNGRAKFTGPGAAGSSSCILANSDSIIYEDLELSNASFGDLASEGESILRTTTDHAALSLIFRRCYFHDTNSKCIFSTNGPAPRSFVANGSGVGDDSGWLFEDCEFARGASSLVTIHGSNWIFKRCHFHNWGNSTFITQARHGVDAIGPNCEFDTCYFHNDEATLPDQGQAISQRVTGLKVHDCVFHDCTPINVFWYDNIRGISIYHSNRGWNLYNNFWYFDAAPDDPGVFSWGPNQVDKFISSNNTWHVRPASNGYDLTSTAAQYIGGFALGNSILLGGYTRAIDFGTHGLSPNNGFTGALVERNNLWFPTGGSIDFRYNTNIYATLGAWQTVNVGGNLQGAGDLLTNPALGLSSAGNPMRAPKPYSVDGVFQSQTDNTLVGSTGGAPDYYPSSSSGPSVNSGTLTLETGIGYLNAGVSDFDTKRYFGTAPDMGATEYLTAIDYTDSGVVPLKLIPSSTDIAERVDSVTAVVALKPSGTEFSQVVVFADTATGKITLSPSGIDTPAGFDTQTILAKLTPSATIIEGYTETSTILLQLIPAGSEVFTPRPLPVPEPVEPPLVISHPKTGKLIVVKHLAHNGNTLGEA